MTVTETRPDVEVARTVRILMAARAMNQQQLAERIGLDPSAISRLMRGQRHWTLDELHRVAEVFGVNICDLFQPEVTVRSRCFRDDDQLHFAFAA